MQGQRNEHGFTLIEVLIASVILLVGVMAVGSSVMAANRSADSSSARHAATNLARRVLEVARVTPGTQLAPGLAQAAIMTAATDLPDADSATAGWQVAQGAMKFSVTVTSCNDDDPFDGYGVTDSSYCEASTPTSPADGSPTDFRLVSVTVAWRSGNVTRDVKQVARTPAGGSGTGGGTDAAPGAGQVSMISPHACAAACPAVTSATVNTVALAATMASVPAGVEWLVNGNLAAACPPATTACAGTGLAWTFQWSIGSAVRAPAGGVNSGMCVAGSYVYDGVHSVGVRGYDSAGRTGEVASIPVTVDRCAPIPPDGFDATGRDGSTGVVDTEWQASPEGDVIGYRVYRGTTVDQRTPVCPPAVNAGQVIALDAVRQCTDPSPPAYVNNTDLYYGVYAVDRDAAGNLREGAISYVNVNTGNRAPNPPTSFAVGGSSAPTLTWSVPSSQDPDSGDSIESFWIYRRAGTVTGSPTHVDRIVRENRTQLCSGTSCTYVDPTPLSGTATYWITAVDTHVRESTVVGPITR